MSFGSDASSSPESRRTGSDPADPVVIMPGESRSSGPRSAAGGGPEAASAELAGLQILAHLLDSLFQIPGLNVRVGLDALLGVIPGLGDVGTSLMSLLILKEANRRGVPRLTMARMTANLAIDTAMGAIPILGDAFDIYWKANERNVALLKKHVASDPRIVRRAQWSDRLFFGVLIGFVLLCLIGSLTVTYLAIRWLTGGPVVVE